MALWGYYRWNAERLGSTTRLRTFILDIGTNLPGIVLSRTALVWLNRLPHSVRRFRSCLQKQGTAASAAGECGQEDQSVDHVAFQCPIYRPPNGLHGLTALDYETID